MFSESAIFRTSAIIATTSLSLFTAEPTPCHCDNVQLIRCKQGESGEEILIKQNLSSRQELQPGQLFSPRPVTYEADVTKRGSVSAIKREHRMVLRWQNHLYGENMNRTCASTYWQVKCIWANSSICSSDQTDCKSYVFLLWIQTSVFSSVYWRRGKVKLNQHGISERHTTPAAPAVMAIGAVTELSPDEHSTGIFTALEIEYAAAKVGVAWNYNRRRWSNKIHYIT